LSLAHVPYIDSVGLGAIVRAYTSARRRGGNLQLLHVEGRNRHLLTITKLLTVFDCLESESELVKRRAAGSL
jgi:anti-sigma B factor antagonist